MQRTAHAPAAPPEPRDRELAGLRARAEAQERALAAAEALLRATAAGLAAAREENGNLAKQVIAAALLHASPERADVEQGIREVVINLIGSEEFAVVEVAPSGALSVLTTFGMDPDRARALPVDGGVAEALGTGRPWLHPDAAGDHGNPIAVLPLRTGPRHGAAVVIWGLLTQKPGWVPFDHELFSLLDVHGGAALYASRLHHAAGAE